MKREFRLKRPKDHERIRRLGKSYTHPLMVLITLPNESLRVRIGVSAGRSIGGAVKRNRAKRLLRSAVSRYLSRITSGNDILLIARRKLLKTRSTELEIVIEKLLSEAKILS